MKLLFKRFSPFHFVSNKLFLVYLLINLFASCGGLTNSKKKNDGIDPELQTNSSLILKPLDYVTYVRREENGLRKVKVIDDITFTAQYKTLPYIVCMEQQSAVIKDSIFYKSIAELKGMRYFDLTIKVNNGAGEILKYDLASAKQYKDRIDYFAFKMQSDIVLVEGKDTLRCDLFHFERTYDVSPESVFVLGFSEQKPIISSDLKLIFIDNTFNKGIVNFDFRKEDLNNAPNLLTSK